MNHLTAYSPEQPQSEHLNREQVRAGLLYLLRIWQNAIRLDEPTLNVWTDALEDIPPSLWEATIRSWVKTGKKFPVPSELIECSRQFFRAKAIAEWQLLLAWANQGARIEAFDLLNLSDRAKLALRAIGGAARLQQCKMNELHFLETDFLQAWLNPLPIAQVDIPRYTVPEVAPPTKEQLQATRERLLQLKAQRSL